MRLLILGDSSAAGVGAGHQSEALAGQLASFLAEKHRIHWKLVAKSGATVGSTLHQIQALEPTYYDFVIIALGVNDAKNGVRVKRWQDGYRALLTTLSDSFGRPLICASGVPHLRDFPLLPKPLNSVLGDRSETFDAVLRDVVEGFDNVFHVPLTFPPDPSMLAADGFHPSPKTYREWARRAAGGFLKAASGSDPALGSD
ncbi:MAG: SGNH/GDSL hydrolase family protein [Pseudomonadota bacterium]